MPRVLIAGINYAPEETGIGVQTTGLAEGLARQGWDVTVITGVPHYPAWRAGPFTPPSPEASVHLIRRGHFVPPRQSVALRAVYESSWIASSLPRLLERREVDVLVGVTPSLGGGALAALGALRWRVPYVLMFQDLLGRAARQSTFPRARFVARGVESLELFLASRAAEVAVIAEGFRSYLVERGVPAERIHRVRSPVRIADPRRDRKEVRSRLDWRDDEVGVVAAGKKGLKQGLENVLCAAALADSEDPFRFVLQGDGNQRSHLERLARDLGVRNVTFSSLVPADELPDVLAAADVLLLNQRREVRDMSLPGKLASYFSAGRPVLAAVAADSEAGREVVALGGGILGQPDDPQGLLRATREFAAKPARS